MVEADGSVKWQTSITDYSSSATGSSVFDSMATARARSSSPTRSFYIFDGATGAILVEMTEHRSTAWEYPLVVDVDNDGQVEVVLGSASTSSSEWNGITVLGSASGSWMPARTIWNQHAYNITNVTATGGIPTTQLDNWDTWNTFRAAAEETGPAQWLPNLRPEDPAICVETCSLDEVTLYLTLSNRGMRDMAGVAVELRDSSDAVLLREVVETTAGGGAVVGPLTLGRDAWGEDHLTLVVDPDEAVEECDEGDNTLDLGPWPCE